MQIHVTINSPSTIPPEVRGKLYVIRHDYNCSDDNFTPYLPRVCNPDGTPKLVGGKPYGLPETEKCILNTWEEMTREWQEFWFALLERVCPLGWPLAQTKDAWANLTHGARAFTNKHGWNDGYADYINGVNLDKQGMKQENVTTCGNVVLQAGEPVMKNGILVLPIVTLDRNLHPPMVDDVIVRPWFIHTATICRPEHVDETPRVDAPNGTFSVIQFPQAGGNDVPVPLITKGGRNYIAMRRLRKLADGERIPSPYTRL